MKELAWYEVAVSDEDRRRHESLGGRGLRMIMASIGNGEALRVRIGHEPVQFVPVLRRLFHFSVSVGRDSGAPGVLRGATNEECEAVKRFLRQKEFEEDSSDTPDVRHFWEKV